MTTKEERAIRVRLIAVELAECRTPGDIEESYAAEWGLSGRQVRRYIQSARQMMREAAKADDADWFAQHTAHRQLVARRALEDGDYHASLAAMKDLARLQQMYAQDKAADAVARLASDQVVQLLKGLGE